MAYSVGRTQTISLYLVLEAAIPLREICTSASMNQIPGLAGQNGGNCIAMAVTVLFGSSDDMSVTVRIVSHKKDLVDGVDLIWVTNSSFLIKNY